MLTDKQKIELLKWCGLFWGQTTDACTLEQYGAWFIPLQGKGCMEVSRDTPPCNLNNLFKWVVPQVIKVLMERNPFTELRALHYIFQAWELEFRKCSNFEEALAEVCYQVLKEGKDETSSKNVC